MNHIEATHYIKATLTAFGPGEAINLTQDTWAKIYEAMSVLVEQPAQQQKPAFWTRKQWGMDQEFCEKPFTTDWEPLYTSPPAQRTWVGLTDVEWMNIVNKNQAWFGIQPDEVAHEVCKLTEAKLREKNGGAA